MKNLFTQQADGNNKLSIALIAAEAEELTRGDLQGPRGYAKIIQSKFGATIDEINAPKLELLYPDVLTYGLRVYYYFQDHGVPDIMMGSRLPIQDNIIDLRDRKYKRSFLRLGTNETRYTRLREDLELVPHHVTPEVLLQEGKHFRAYYPDVNENLIGIMFVNKAQKEVVANGLVTSVKDNQPTTIFVCSCGRTEDQEYDDFIWELKKAIDKSCKPINVVGYNLNRERHKTQSYNPYLGLINQADHLIVLGKSSSIMSECIVSGKTIYKDYARRFPNLLNSGLVKDIGQTALRGVPLETTRFSAPPNVTEEIAMGILREYYKKRDGAPLYYAKKVFGRAPI
jgi:hypothetical protein